MSRTLHYGTEDNFMPNEKQSFALFQLVHEYNTRFNWTGETIDLSELRIYPNYDKLPAADWNEAENVIYEHILKLVENGATLQGAYAKLQEEGLITFRKKDALKVYTKVSSNELNAHTVIQFILAASKLLPEATFYLIDEGYALYCPLLIQDGRAKPKVDDIEEYLEHYNVEEYPELKQKLDYYTRIYDEGANFGDIQGYIRPLKDAAYLQKRNEFETKVIESSDKIGDAMNEIILSEKEESAKYYEDINSYPV